MASYKDIVADRLGKATTKQPSTVVTNKSQLPTSNLTSGEFAFVDSDDKLYISDGGGWYNIQRGIGHTGALVELLVVGGGGGAGGISGGGGGAGEMVDLTSAAAFRVYGNTNYTITVGAGGDGELTSAGNNGSDSQFGAIVAKGGGGGAHAGSIGPTSGGSGGGGGTTGSVVSGAAAGDHGAGGYNTYRYKNAGGDGSNGANSNYVGGGGGGAGAV